MKDFGRARGRLRALPLAARVVYSVFLGFTLLGLGFSVWLTEAMLGPDLGQLDSYYAGGPAPELEADSMAGGGTPLPPGGPVLELPDELDAPPAREPMALRRLLEVTHFHLFSMPVYLMILSHLFMLSTLGERAKLGWIGAASLATLAHMAAPWLARTGSAGSALAYASSGSLLLLSFAVMGAVALWEMWTPGPPKP